MGASVGATVGFGVGSAVGLGEGGAVGFNVGTAVAARVGTTVGAVGSGLGGGVGGRVGRGKGEAEGGRAVGVSLGSGLGSRVGGDVRSGAKTAIRVGGCGVPSGVNFASSGRRCALRGATRGRDGCGGCVFGGGGAGVCCTMRCGTGDAITRGAASGAGTRTRGAGIARCSAVTVIASLSCVSGAAEDPTGTSRCTPKKSTKSRCNNSESTYATERRRRIPPTFGPSG